MVVRLQGLRLHVIACLLALLIVADPVQGQSEPDRFPVVSSEDAWALLPECVEGRGQPLPVWARMLVTSLPRTTASMLEMDTVYRTSRELDPAFRARLRWTVAAANKCEPGMRQATGDMRRTGVADEDVTAWTSGSARLSPAEARALGFVDQLTRRAWTITDEQFATVLADSGERKMLAIILQTAYANFQDRLLLALGVGASAFDDSAPPAVRFAAVAADADIAVARPPLPDASTLPPPEIEFPPGWETEFSFHELLDGMQKQQVRRERIQVPAWEIVQPLIPQEIYAVKKPVRIKWSLTAMGYQPELTAYWLRSMRLWYRESKADQVLNESLFWVVTRNLQCFY
jgi:alkylhydroperoxidase family enzyme